MLCLDFFFKTPPKKKLSDFLGDTTLHRCTVRQMWYFTTLISIIFHGRFIMETFIAASKQKMMCPCCFTLSFINHEEEVP